MAVEDTLPQPLPVGGVSESPRSAPLLHRLHRSQHGATMLEWTLLLAAIALPSYLIIRLGLATLVAHYQMVTTLNNLPFP